MARYIKANPKVAQYLHLENDRNQVKDGNFLLWQADMLAFGRLTELPQILEQIGGIALAAHEARQEQDGTVIRELPTATDSRFVVENSKTEQPDDATEVHPEEPQPGTEENGEVVTPAEGEASETAPEELEEKTEQPETSTSEQTENINQETETA